jgi:hypothetical protein
MDPINEAYQKDINEAKIENRYIAKVFDSIPNTNPDMKITYSKGRGRTFVIDGVDIDLVWIDSEGEIVFDKGRGKELVVKYTALNGNPRKDAVTLTYALKKIRST